MLLSYSARVAVVATKNFSTKLILTPERQFLNSSGKILCRSDGRYPSDQISLKLIGKLYSSKLFKLNWRRPRLSCLFRGISSDEILSVTWQGQCCSATDQPHQDLLSYTSRGRNQKSTADDNIRTWIYFICLSS